MGKSGKKSLKRRIRRFLYRSLTALNKVDFSKYRPLYVLFTLAMVSLFLAKLPILELCYNDIVPQTSTIAVQTSERIIQDTQNALFLTALLQSPAQRAVCIFLLLSVPYVLLWFLFSRLHRIRIWFRIYRIRRRKRSTHTLFLKKRFRKFRGI